MRKTQVANRLIFVSERGRFALRIVRLYTSLPRTAEGQVLGKQVLRRGTSVGAHYHEATRARSNAEFISKLQGGLPELEETIYWLSLLIDSGIVKKEKLSELLPGGRRVGSDFGSLSQDS
jgi:four helix bundle protein